MPDGSLVAHLRARALLRQGRRRRARARAIPPARWPTAIAHRYLRQLLALLDQVHDAVRLELLPVLPSLVATHNATRLNAEAARLDDTGATTRDIFGRVRDRVEQDISQERLEQLAQDTGLRVAEHTRGELERQVRAVARIDLHAPAQGLATHLEAFIADNVRLVKSLAGAELDDLEGLVLRGARQGLRVEVLQRQIRERFAVSKRKAALLARDQVGKLNGEITELRHQQLGITRYRWSTSKDERVRKDHQALEGTVQRWAKPPVVNKRTGARAHPGQDIQCRCQPIPIVDDVLVEAGLLDQAEADAALEQHGAPAAPPASSRAPGWMSGPLELVAARKAGRGIMGAEIADVLAPGGRTHRVVWKQRRNEQVLQGVSAGTLYEREAAMYDLDRELGGETVVPPTVARRLDGELGSMQQFVKGAVPTPAVSEEIARVGALAMAQDPRVRRVFLLDTIAANIDRHAENVLWLPRRSGPPRLIAIDNGAAFPAGMPARVLFPLPGDDLGEALLKLDPLSVEQVANLQLSRVADILKSYDGITPDQIYTTLVRLRSLQRSPRKLGDLPADSNPRWQLLGWHREMAERNGSLRSIDLAEIRKAAGLR